MTTFQPYGYMMDEGGAEWVGLQKECGEQEVEVAKSCQFHYLQVVNREAAKQNSSGSKFEFKKIGNTMPIRNCRNVEIFEEFENDIICFSSRGNVITLGNYARTNKLDDFVSSEGSELIYDK